MPGHLRAIAPDASPEEVAAIVVALGVLRAAPAEPETDDTLHEWVRVARLASRRAVLQRGPWRMSGRIGQRTGA